MAILTISKKINRNVSQVGFLYVAEGRIRNMFKWFWLIFSSAVADPFLYLISIGLGVGKLVNSNSTIDGVNYLTFLAPALLASAAIQNTLDEIIFPTLQGFKWTKSFYAMNSTPLTSKQISLGVYFSALARTTFTVVIYFFIMKLFGAIDTPHAWLAIFSSLFCAAGFAAIMFAMVSMTENDDLFLMIVGRLIIMPLFLFSGTFFPLENLPKPLQIVGWLSPLWHGTDLGRYLTYGHELSSSKLLFHIFYILILLVIGLLWTFKNFERRLSK
jgi:lipooligosaccharide transport system permease protein